MSVLCASECWSVHVMPEVFKPEPTERRERDPAEANETSTDSVAFWVCLDAVASFGATGIVSFFGRGGAGGMCRKPFNKKSLLCANVGASLGKGRIFLLSASFFAVGKEDCEAESMAVLLAFSFSALDASASFLCRTRSRARALPSSGDTRLTLSTFACAERMLGGDRALLDAVPRSRRSLTGETDVLRSDTPVFNVRFWLATVPLSKRLRLEVDVPAPVEADIADDPLGTEQSPLSAKEAVLTLSATTVVACSGDGFDACPGARFETFAVSRACPAILLTPVRVAALGPDAGLDTPSALYRLVCFGTYDLVEPNAVRRNGFAWIFS